MVMQTLNPSSELPSGFKEELDRDGFASRLEAVRQERGAKSVRAFALAIGVHPTSMRSYLKSMNDPTRENLIRIARHCAVSVEWLATGRGPKHPETYYPELIGHHPVGTVLPDGSEVVQGPFMPFPGIADAPPAAPPAPTPILDSTPPDQNGTFANIDFNRMVDAMRYGLDAYDKRGTRPDPDQLTRIVMALYEHLGSRPEVQQPEALAHILSAPWVPEHRRYAEQLYRDAAAQEKGE